MAPQGALDKVLIVGIGGGYGRPLARRLLRECAVAGVDRGGFRDGLAQVSYHDVDPRTRALESALRKERPDAVVHLGFVRDFSEPPSERHDLNVRGTRHLLDECLAKGVPRVIVLSSSYTYGALPENPSFMDEEHPLSGSRNYPELRDLVEIDALSTAFMWRHPELRLSVLRPVPVLGAHVESAFARYLRLSRVPAVMGFNPMMQFLHEEDLVSAIERALRLGLRGVYNVTGSGEVPMHVAVREAGGRLVPLPEFLLRRFATRVLGIPPGAVDFLKYSCTISGRRFREATGFRPQFSLKEIFRSVR